MKLATLVVLAGTVVSCLGARILGLLPMPSRSHGILMERLLRELGNRGHQITYITASPPVHDAIPNMTLIHIPDMQKVIFQSNSTTKKETNMFELKGLTGWFMFFFALSGPRMCDYILNYPPVHELIQSDKKFDLVLAETFLDESLIAGFSHRFKAPVVGVMSFMPNIWGNYLTGNPAPSSYIPEPSLGLSTKMNFFERMYNFIFTLCWDVFHSLIYLPQQDAIMKKHFGESYPNIHGILRKTSLVLVNHHYALAFPRSYLPNMVEVAGMHINPVKPLPADLQKFLDDSKQGAILFSMGSNLKSSEMPPELVKSILKAFERLPYNVLWKFEADLPNLPKNVRINKWLPQSDILAHPNIKLFITHGGLLSTTEAVHRGVPVLGIPIFGDQPLNMKHTENAGLGKTLNFENLNENTLYDAIVELILNPRYSSAAKLRSSVFRDNLNSPLEKAVWWVEYVIRHEGAEHLRSAAQDLAWYEVHQLDTLATLTVVLLAASYLSILIIRTVIFKLCSKKSQDTIARKKKIKKTN